MLIPKIKITVPEIPVQFVDRPALRTRLDDASGIVLVCAPPGYGKTVLLTDWARRCAPDDVAWVRVDREDNDPARFWTAVAAAIAERAPLASGRRPGPAARRPGGPPEIVTELVDALPARPRPVHLVLDDLHEMVDPETLHGLADFIANRPAGLRLILSGRLDPPVSLARLRLAGRLQELRAEQLRFSPREAAALLAMACPGLTAAEIEMLHRRTGGWAAGLRLAALGVAGTADPGTFLSQFSGDDRSVADYLAEQVLSALPRDLLDFLRVISVCDPVPVELAVELSGRDDAGALLDHVEHRTSLVSPTGRGREAYHVQELLRTHLLADLRRREGAIREAALHAVAARWWTDRNQPVPALDHAAHSKDGTLLPDTIRRCVVPLVLSGDHAPLRRALTTAGPWATATNPWLALSSALAHLEAGERRAADQDLLHARRYWPGDAAPELRVLRALAERWDGSAAGGTVPDALDDLPPVPGLEALGRLLRGVARLSGDGDGDRDGARAELEAALELARRHGFDHLAMQCLTLLATAAGAAGDLRAVRSLSREATACAAAHGWERSPWSLGSTAMLAYTSLLRAEPAEAQRLTARVLAPAPGTPPPALLFALRSVHGAAVFDEGERALGLAELQEARVALGEVAVAPVQAAAAAVLELRAALMLGHATVARSVQQWLTDRVGETAEVFVARARAEAAAGRSPHAREMLRPVLDGAVPALLSTTAVDAWLLETALAAAAGARPAARQALQTALGLGEPLDALRPFAEAGSRVRSLLLRQQGTFGPAGEFADRALDAGAGSRDLPTGLLSERESAVLAMLPSLKSLDEIAADLTVSVNTVKSHVRSIYTKLGVSSRRLAVLAARERGLLSVSMRAG